MTTNFLRSKTYWIVHPVFGKLSRNNSRARFSDCIYNLDVSTRRNEQATRQIAIQVKTSQPSRPEWMLSKKAETYHADNLCYVFVILQTRDALPKFYIVPRAEVARQIYDEHQEWLSTPGRNGRAQKDNNIRIFRDNDRAYHNRWNLLGL